MDFTPFRKYPQAWCLAALILGCWWASHYFNPENHWPWVSLVLGFLGMLFLWRNPFPWRWIFLGLFFFSLGILRVGDRFIAPLEPPMSRWVQESKLVPVLLRAGEYCQGRGGRSSFRGDLLGWYEGKVFHPLRLPLLWKVRSPQCPAHPGQAFRALAKFNVPRAFGNPSSPDYPRVLRAQGILVQGRIRGADWMVPLGNHGSRLWNLRGRLLEFISKNCLTSPARGIFEALLLRWKGDLAPETERDFREAGLAHVLVVSGLHMALVAAFGYFLFYGLGSVWRQGSARGWVRLAAFLASGLCTLVFCFLVGWSASVWRAFGLVIWVLLVAILKLKRDSLYSLMTLAFLMILLRPAFLWDLGFHLSFLSVTILIFFGRHYEKAWEALVRRYPKGNRRWLKWGLGILGSTLAIQVFLFPLTSMTFHQVSMVSPLANLMMLPFFTMFLMPGLFLSLGLEVFGWGAWLLKILTWATEGVMVLVHRLVSIPGAVRWVEPMSPLAWWVYGFFVLFFILGVGVFKRKLISRWLILFGIFGTLVLNSLPWGSQELVVTLLDVGQGESILITLPNREGILIDGGGFPGSDFDLGQKVILPELLRRRIRRLRALVLAHPDSDHYKGFTTLVGQFPISEFWYGHRPWKNEPLRDLRDKLKQQNIRLKSFQRGDGFYLGGAHWEILWPPKVLDQVKDNNQSLVLRVCGKETCILLTGDIEESGEKGILASGLPLKSRYLKLGHHGSKTSTSMEFLNRVDPEVALVSLGKRNRFGFPHREILSRLKKKGIKLRRTDLEGQIEIRIPSFGPIPNR